MANDYIPAADSLFDEWIRNFDTLLTAAPATYGLSAPDAVAVAAVTSAWSAAYTLAIDPGTRTPATVAAKDAARASATAVVRPYAVSISQNPAVDPADKVSIGVTLRSLVRTPIPAPTTAPAISIRNAIPGQQTLDYKEPSFAGKAKPFGVRGCQVFASFGEVYATDPGQANYVQTVTKTPFLMPVEPGQVGKKCTVFARWETVAGPGGKAQVGPWSAPLNFIAQ